MNAITTTRLRRLFCLSAVGIGLQMVSGCATHVGRDRWDQLERELQADNQQSKEAAIAHLLHASGLHRIDAPMGVLVLSPYMPFLNGCVQIDNQRKKRSALAAAPDEIAGERALVQVSLSKHDSGSANPTDLNIEGPVTAQLAELCAFMFGPQDQLFMFVHRDDLRLTLESGEAFELIRVPGPLARDDNGDLWTYSATPRTVSAGELLVEMHCDHMPSPGPPQPRAVRLPVMRKPAKPIRRFSTSYDEKRFSMTCTKNTA